MTSEQEKEYDTAFPDVMPVENYPPMSSQEMFDADLIALIKNLHRLIKHDADIIFRTEAAHTAWWDMKATLEQFEPWLEIDNDPRSMGWVNDKGLP